MSDTAQASPQTKVLGVNGTEQDIAESDKCLQSDTNSDEFFHTDKQNCLKSQNGNSVEENSTETHNINTENSELTDLGLRNEAEGCTSFPDDWSEWSLLNDPEFSVHNFYVPTDVPPGSKSTNSHRNTDHLHLNGELQQEELLDCPIKSKTPGETNQERQISSNVSYPSNGDDRNEPGEGDDRLQSPGNSLWYIPSSNSLVCEQPRSLPELCTHAQNIDNTVNGHGRKYRGDQETENAEPSDLNFKTSLMSVWNNMKNGFTVQMKTNFKYDCALWLLGNVYHSTKEDKERQREEHERGRNYITPMDLFKSDFASKIWFTYRKDFMALPYSQLTTDMGWGCMLRTGQMMLAQALVMHLLHRGWRHLIHRGQEDILHHRILQFFNDKDSSESPFSLHNLVRIGKRYDKLPGDWYGPSSAAYVIRDAMSECGNIHPLLSNLCLYVAQDCTVYIEDVVDLCTQRTSHLINKGEASTSASNNSPNSSPHPWKSVIILIPVRLGGVDMNRVYTPCIKNMLAYSMCLGVIGGKPKHSLYFVGWQEEKLVYFDPHFCQDHVDSDDASFSTTSFHCNDPRKISINKMDPSCTIGFYCKTKEEFDLFIKDAQQMVIPPQQSAPYPMFVFQKGRSEESVNKDCSLPETDRILKVSHYDSEGRKRPPKTSDDFVFL